MAVKKKKAKKVKKVSKKKKTVKKKKKTVRKAKAGMLSLSWWFTRFKQPVIVAVMIAVAATSIGVLSFVIRHEKDRSVEKVAASQKQARAKEEALTKKMKAQEKQKAGGFREEKKSMKPALSPVISAKSTALPSVQTSVKVKPEIEAKFASAFTAVDSVAGIHRVDIEAAKYLYDSGKAVFLDARGQHSYDRGHIKGAYVVQHHELAKDTEKYKEMFKGKVVVTYCSGASCRMSDKLAAAFFNSGFKNVAIFFGGWSQWTTAKYATESKSVKKP